MVRPHLADYVQVRSLMDGEAVLEAVRHYARQRAIDRVESLWEPFMMLAAELREALGLPGMTRAQTHRFRDKEAMQQALDEAGLRTPRHIRAAGDVSVEVYIEGEEYTFADRKYKRPFWTFRRVPGSPNQHPLGPQFSFTQPENLHSRARGWPRHKFGANTP